MISKVEKIQQRVGRAREALYHEVESLEYNEEKKALLLQARFRLKQAWHLLDEASEL